MPAISARRISVDLDTRRGTNRFNREHRPCRTIGQRRSPARNRTRICSVIRSSVDSRPAFELEPRQSRPHVANDHEAFSAQHRRRTTFGRRNRSVVSTGQSGLSSLGPSPCRTRNGNSRNRQAYPPPRNECCNSCAPINQSGRGNEDDASSDAS
jgi:hypothetical protein